MFRRKVIIAVLAIVFFCTSWGIAIYVRPAANTMSKISIGMDKKHVLKTVGSPSSTFDASESHCLRCSEVWSFGVDKVSGFPMLGQIGFNESNCVVWSSGRASKFIDAEADCFGRLGLGGILSLLDECDSIEGEAWDPEKITNLVNALQPLGKANAMLVVREYFRLVPPPVKPYKDEILLVLELLNQKPTQGFPLGQPVPAPDNVFVAPEFPIHVVSGVPFLLTSGFESVGLGVNYEKIFVDYEQESEWLASPLVAKLCESTESEIELVISRLYSYKSQREEVLSLAKKQLTRIKCQEPLMDVTQ